MHAWPWFDESFTERLSITLLHFLWQGCLIAVLVFVLARMLRRASSQLRYCGNVAALLLLVCCLPVTFAILAPPHADHHEILQFEDAKPDSLETSVELGTETAAILSTPRAATDHQPATPVAEVETPVPETLAENVSQDDRWLPHPWVETLIATYFIGVALMLARLAGALWGGQRLRRSAIPIQESDLLLMLKRQATTLRLKAVPLLAYCEEISTPVVVGILRPMVLLPAALAGGLTPDQLQSIVTHELAHIRRFDLLVSLLQRLAEAFLFFHPAVWYVNRRINVERENATDDMVLAAGFQPVHYADALVRMAELSMSLRRSRTAGQSVALAAAGDSESEFKRRVLRLVDIHNQPRLRLTRWGLSLFIAITLAAAGSPFLVEIWADQDAETDKQSEKPEPEEQFQVRIRAIDEVTGKPIPNLTIRVRLENKDTWHEGNGDGEFTAKLPSSTPRYCDFTVRAKGYVPMRADWNNRAGRPRDEIPKAFTFSMARPITVGGTVVDEDDKPVTGATVLFSAMDRNSYLPWRERQEIYEVECVTDGKGRWRCDLAPPKLHEGMFKVNHSEFMPTGLINLQNKGLIEQVKLRSHRLVLQRGFAIRGRVTDPDGQPIDGAFVALNNCSDTPDEPFITTDADGRYVFERVAPRTTEAKNRNANRMSVTAIKPGFAPQVFPVPRSRDSLENPADPDERVVDFQLKPGATARLRVIDSGGKPISNLNVRPDYWRDSRTLYFFSANSGFAKRFDIPLTTDDRGVWEWTWAPPGDSIKYLISGEGFMTNTDCELTAVAAGAEAEVKILRSQVIAGLVVDSETKQPIDTFIVEQGSENRHLRDIHWSNLRRNRNGRFRREVTWPWENGYRYRISAAGYEAYITENFPVEPGEVRRVFHMKKAIPKAEKGQSEKPGTTKPESKPQFQVQIRAVDEATGKPIANPKFGVQLGKDLNWHDGDARGKFVATLPTAAPRYCYLKVRADGYTPMRAFWRNGKGRPRDDVPRVFTFPMTKAITVGGTVVDEDGKPVPGATVRFGASDLKSHPGRRATASFRGEEYTTDEQGRWTCDLAPPQMSSGSVKVNHPDFVDHGTNISVDNRIEQLMARTLRSVLKRGFVVRGRVIDPAGNPVEGAILAQGELNSYSHKGPFIKTDREGRYRFEKVAPRNQGLNDRQPNRMTITVVKPGYAPQQLPIPGFGDAVDAQFDPLERIIDFQMQPGVTIKMKFVDTTGNPIPNYHVMAQLWKETQALEAYSINELGIPRRSNKDGVWEWTWAPPGDRITYYMYGRGYMRIHNHKLTAGPNGLDETIEIARPQVITGIVVDKVTKQPINEFVVEKGFLGMAGHPDGISWGSERQGRRGKFRRETVMPHKQGYRYRILAEGYEPYVTDVIPVVEGEVQLRAFLQRAAASKPKSRESREPPESPPANLRQPMPKPIKSAGLESTEPTLAFLSWSHNPPEDANVPLDGEYWLPSGKRIVSQDALAPLRRVGRGRNTERVQWPVLHLFVSDPGFTKPSWGRLELLSSNGKTPNLSYLRPSNTRYALPAKGLPGWMLFQVESSSIPANGAVRLRYASGVDVKKLHEFSVDASPGRLFDADVSPDVGAYLLGIGERANGNSFVSIFVEPRWAADFEYYVTAADQRKQQVWPSNVLRAEATGDSVGFTFEFGQPLSASSGFRLSRSPLKTISFRNVSFRPKDKGSQSQVVSGNDGDIKQSERGKIAAGKQDVASKDPSRQPLRKRPAGLSPQAQYCLLTFGARADKQIWMIHDADQLYVDLNGNGDLSEPGERFLEKEEKGFQIPGITSRGFVIPPSRQSPPQLRRYFPMRVSWQSSGEQYLWVRLIVEGRFWQESTISASVNDAEYAPILHFDGPLSYMLLHPNKHFTQTAKHLSGLSIGLGTVSPTGDTTYVQFDDRPFDEKLLPQLTVRYFPTRDAKPQPIGHTNFKPGQYGGELIASLKPAFELQRGEFEIEVSDQENSHLSAKALKRRIPLVNQVLDAKDQANDGAPQTNQRTPISNSVLANNEQKISTAAKQADPQTAPKSQPQANGETIDSHTDRVLSVAFSPDGKLLATGGGSLDTKLARLNTWDVQSRRLLRNLEGHTSSISSLAFSPDGKLLVSGSYNKDRTARLWDVATGKEKRILSRHDDLVTCVMFSPDGKEIASASYDGTVKFYDAASFAQTDSVEELTAAEHSPYAIAYSPDGKSVAIADIARREHPVVRRYERKSLQKQEPLRLGGRNCQVYSVVYSPDGKTIATASNYKIVRLWDAETGKVRHVLKDHTRSVKCVAFSPDGNTLATGGSDKSIRFWDVETGKAGRVLFGHQENVRALAFSPNGKLLASAGGESTDGKGSGEIMLWDLEK